MATATVRISDGTRSILRGLARQEGESMQAVLDKAIEVYRRRRFLEATNAAYAALREDKDAWSDLRRERAAWDATLMDGLDRGETWSENGKARKR